MTQRLPAAVPLERYVDARELAALMGVSTRTIKRFVAAGMPSETWGMSRTRRYQPSRCIAWAQARRTIGPSRGSHRNAPGRQQQEE